MDRNEIAKHMGQILICLFGMSIIVFGLIHLSPGDPAMALLTMGGTTPSPELLAATRHDMGLDRPLIEQYFIWIINALQGDFGISYASGAPVLPILLGNLKNTMILAVTALAMTLLISIPVGVYTAIKQNTVVDYIVRGLSFLGISMPTFWMGLLFLYFFGLKLGWIPIVGAEMSLKKVILPALTIALSQASQYIRQIRALMIEELQKDYVMVNRARGLSEATILWRHIVPNVMMPLLVLVGLTFGWMLGGVAVVEVIFSWPGLGKLAVSAINNRNYPVVQGYVLLCGLIYLGINFIIDVLYYIIDPRMRSRGE